VELNYSAGEKALWTSNEKKGGRAFPTPENSYAGMDMWTGRGRRYRRWPSRRHCNQDDFGCGRQKLAYLYADADGRRSGCGGSGAAD